MHCDPLAKAGGPLCSLLSAPVGAVGASLLCSAWLPHPGREYLPILKASPAGSDRTRQSAFFS